MTRVSPNAEGEGNNKETREAVAGLWQAEGRQRYGRVLC
jgi:hypothetical protein